MNKVTAIGLSAILSATMAGSAFAQGSEEVEQFTGWSESMGYANAHDVFVEVADGCLKTPRWTDDLAREPCDEVPAPPREEAVMMRASAVIEAQALFDFDKDNIRPDAEVALQELVQEMAGAAEIVGIAVTGHTDNIGAPDYNMGLSQRRADSVKDGLAGLGVDPGLITTVAMGETDPIADNSTSEGRQMNRRVQIEVEAIEEVEAVEEVEVIEEVEEVKVVE